MLRTSSNSCKVLSALFDVELELRLEVVPVVTAYMVYYAHMLRAIGCIGLAALGK